MQFTSSYIKHESKKNPHAYIYLLTKQCKIVALYILIPCCTTVLCDLITYSTRISMYFGGLLNYIIRLWFIVRGTVLL